MSFHLSDPPCSGCGLRSCDGRCFLECPTDYDENDGIALDELRRLYGDPLTDQVEHELRFTIEQQRRVG
jgi:hypothetical protein